MKVKVTKFRTKHTVISADIQKLILILFKLNSVAVYEETIGATLKLLVLNTNGGN